MNQFDNRQKKDPSINPAQKESKLDQATMPEQNRDEVRRRFKSVDQRKGAELLNQGVHDRSNDAGRDAILDPGRIARPQMMEMIKGVLPELNSHPSYQAQEFLKAFENPALIRSYLINPQETAAALMQRFPDLQDVILKNMPFQKRNGELKVNPDSGLYQLVRGEIEGGVRAKDSFVRKEMDHLLKSPIGARFGGSMGMETKAYELIRNKIETTDPSTQQEQFTKKGAILIADISRLMQSPQARQDFKEAQALANKGPLPPQASVAAVSASVGVPVAGGGTVDSSQLRPVSPPTPANATTSAPNPSPTTPAPAATPAPTPAPGIPVAGGGTVNPANLTPVPPPVQPSGAPLTAPPLSTTIPGVASAPAPAAPAGAAPAPTPPSPAPAPAGATPAAPAPAAATPAAPAPAAATPATPAPAAVTPATPAPAATTPAAPAPAGAIPAAPAPAGATPATPAPSTPAQPANNLITDRERMLQEQVAQLEARVKKEASTPVTPAPPAAPAPSAELEQLKKENKDLNDRLAKVEKSLDELMKKNSALEKENAELKAKVAELEKRNAELERAQKQEPVPADKQSTEPKQALTDEQIKARAKELYGAIGYVYDDEAKVYSSLAGLSSADQGRLAATFKKEYGKDMDAYIADSLNEKELAIVMKLREGSRPGTEDAIKAYNIFNGWTNKDDLTQALKGKSVEEIAAMAKKYEYITGESFQDAVKSEFWFESDRKPFLDLVDHAQEAVQLVGSGSPVFKRAHQAISSLPPEASIDEARAWATKNRALFEGLGATPGNQAEFINYLQKVHGFKKDQATVDPGEFFNQKIADAAVREIANAVTYRTIRPISRGVGDRAAPITVPEPDPRKIGEIYTSLSDLPDVQSLIKNHPDVKKFALETKPVAAAVPAGPPLQPNITANTFIDLLNKDGGAIEAQDFVVTHRETLASMSDEELTQAFRSVAPAELRKFAKSLRDDDGILTPSILSRPLLTEEDASQLQRVSDLATEVAEK